MICATGFPAAFATRINFSCSGAQEAGPFAADLAGFLGVGGLDVGDFRLFVLGEGVGGVFMVLGGGGELRAGDDGDVSVASDGGGEILSEESALADMVGERWGLYALEWLTVSEEVGCWLGSRGSLY